MTAAHLAEKVTRLGDEERNELLVNLRTELAVMKKALADKSFELKTVSSTRVFY